MSLLFPLMRRDPIWRFMPFAVLAGFGALALDLKSPALQGGIAGIVGSLYMAFLGQARIHERASTFEAALPIDGRDLLRARLASLLLFLWLPVAVALLVCLWFGPAQAVRLAWPLGSAAMAASATVVLLQLYGLPRIGVAKAVALAAWLSVLVICIAVAFLVHPEPGATSPLLGLAAIGLLIAAGAFRAWPKSSLALQLSPVELQRADLPASAATTGDPGSWVVLLRSLLNTQTTVWFGFAAFYPLLNNFVMPLCFVPGYVTGAYMSLRWMFPLPISRRRILGVILLPFLALYAISAMVNLTWGIGSDGDQAIDPRPAGLRLASPWWKHVAAGETPVVQAPWGETHSPQIKRVWLVRSYNPWETGPENSRQFRDWQFRRATQAVFGQEVDWADRARLDDLRPLNRRPVENILNVAALLFLSMFLVSFILIPRWSRISHLPAPVRKYGVMALLLPFVAALAFSPILAEPLGNTGILDVFSMAWADTVRANPVAAWSTVLLVLWLMYALLGKQFSELEPDNQPASAKGRSPFGGGLFS